jgi:hypothetical protein
LSQALGESVELVVLSYPLAVLFSGYAVVALWGKPSPRFSATPATAVGVSETAGVIRLTGRLGCAFVRQPKAGECHAGQADAEFLQCRAARDRLGQALGEFIELVVHVFPFVWLSWLSFQESA